MSESNPSSPGRAVMSKEFENAINCVLRGGKAWREYDNGKILTPVKIRAELLLSNQGELMVARVHTHADGRAWLHGLDDKLHRDDLTATDWVTEEVG